MTDRTFPHQLPPPSLDLPAGRTGGYCRACGLVHSLGPGNTREYARQLMAQLERLGSIDLFSDRRAGERVQLATAPLFGEDRGKMFGVLECRRADGTTTFLHAFSGQFGGQWLVDGWAPPLFPVDRFVALTADRDRDIKRLGWEMAQEPMQSAGWRAKRRQRRLLSRTLMAEIHRLYRLANFRGETTDLYQAFLGPGGIPTGTGDCCAPKLLNQAATAKLYPVGISEFFWGRENVSAEHAHGFFTSPCREKCQPILGFMLCGLDHCRSTSYPG